MSEATVQWLFSVSEVTQRAGWFTHHIEYEARFESDGRIRAFRRFPTRREADAWIEGARAVWDHTQA